MRNLMHKTLKINRKKMETEKWAVAKWTSIGNAQAYWNREEKLSSPFMQGSEIKSKIMRKKVWAAQTYLERKQRQVELILAKIGYNYQ